VADVENDTCSLFSLSLFPHLAKIYGSGFIRKYTQ